MRSSVSDITGVRTACKRINGRRGLLEAVVSMVHAGFYIFLPTKPILGFLSAVSYLSSWWQLSKAAQWGKTRYLFTIDEHSAIQLTGFLLYREISGTAKGGGQVCRTEECSFIFALLPAWKDAKGLGPTYVRHLIRGDEKRHGESRSREREKGDRVLNTAFGSRKRSTENDGVHGIRANHLIVPGERVNENGTKMDINIIKV